MRSLFAAAVLLSVPCFADEFEVFVDRGETYIRAGAKAGLDVGSDVTIIGKDKKQLGVATVMEVWPALARVSLDEASRGDKGAKYAVVGGAAKKPAAAPAPPPPPPPTPPPAAAGAADGTLKGHATFKGAGPWKMLQLYNDGSSAWTRCELTLLPHQQRYTMATLKGDDHEAIAWSNFKGPDHAGDPVSVSVKCAQGAATFRFPND